MNPLTKVASAVGAHRRITAAAVVVVAIAVAATAMMWPRGDGLPKNAAFSYRGTVVTIPQLQQRMHVLHALYGVSEPKGSTAKDKYWRAAAQADAMSMILEHAAAADGIVVTDRQANALLQQMVSSQLSGSGASSLSVLLKKFGVSEADVLLEVKRQEEIGLLFQKVTRHAAAKPSDADVATYFQAHAADFAIPEKRHLLNIVVATKTQAEAIIAAAKTTSFSTLAKRYSLDDATRSKGGDLGTAAASALDTTYAAAAFAAPSGGIYGPVQTQFGWNVGKVVAVVASRSVALSEVQANVVSALQSSRAMAAWRTWLAHQVAAAGVRYASAYRPVNPLQLPAVNLPSPQAP